MTKNSKLKFYSTVVHPGESANLALPLPEQYSCSPLYMHIKVIHGKIKGPCIAIFAVFKGNELNGLEIVNRLTDIIDAADVHGTIIAIPVVNVYGLTHYPKMLPSGNNLLDCFPGNENGNFGERVADLFTNILKHADYCIELQTGELNHNILPQVYCNFDDLESKKLAKVFNTPVVTDSKVKSNKFRNTMEDFNIPSILYQAGEGMRFDENAIALGVEGVKNVMHKLNMIDKPASKKIDPIFSKDEEWITAHKAGILHSKVSLGQTIKKNESIGTITDPFGAAILEPVRSPREGIVVGVNTAPLIYEGLQIFKIASFLDYNRAESSIEAWDQKQPDSYIN